LAGIATSQKLRILCCREYQTSIRESVHQLLSSQIDVLGLSKFYSITRDSIRSHIGTEFIFKGLHANATEIKSTEGIDICWIEEAQSVSDESWEYLIPTVRKDPPFGPFKCGSEIWLTWNTGETKDPTYQRFVQNPPDDCISKKATWRDNPFFPQVLEKERLYLQRVDPDAYDHVWEGNPKSVSDACIYKNKFIEEAFEAHRDQRMLQGCDWGFSNDPTAALRCWIKDNHLYIEYEAYGIGVELDEIPDLFRNSIPDFYKWKSWGDESRPETISYLKKKHSMNIEAAPKGKGSVEDGISFIKKFEKIHVHPRCKHTLEELKLYSYKQDSKTQEVLPIIVDKNNHLMDALRYALCQQIKGGIDWVAFVG